MTTWYYFARPSNLAFHDLTPGKVVPPAARSLLGLSLKFIPTPKVTTCDLQPSFTRFERDLHIKAYFAGDDSLISKLGMNEAPKLYVRSNWTPPPWEIPNAIIDRMKPFQRAMKTSFRYKRGTSNLLPFQKRLLSHFQRDKSILIVNTDKGLGTAAQFHHLYIKDAVVGHLGDRRIYSRLSRLEANAAAKRIKTEIAKWIKRWSHELEDTTKKFLRHHLKANKDPFGYFYLLYKIHKTPYKTRPVCSGSGSLLHPLGMYIDEMLQPIARSMQSFFESSYCLKRELVSLNIPRNARLFTCDAVSMYTNIPTPPALRLMESYLFENRDRWPHMHPEALTAALKLVMRNNIFRFGDCWFKQRTGTAMGTPPAPPWATIFFGFHEKDVLAEYGDQLLLYRRFIDDVLGIWLCHPDPVEDARLWSGFQEMINNFHGMEWEFTDRGRCCDFMDLTIQIADGKIHTTLFEKALNLHLYIPPHSAHPPGVLKGLIMGGVMRMHTLCSSPEDVQQKLRLLFRRLRARGYNSDDIIPIFSKAVTNAKDYMKNGPRRKADDLSKKRVFFHLEYHPNDPPSSVVQQYWRQNFLTPPSQRPLPLVRNHADHPVEVEQMTVAYSRPPNLGNLLSYRRIDKLNGPKVSSFLD